MYTHTHTHITINVSHFQLFHFFRFQCVCVYMWICVFTYMRIISLLIWNIYNEFSPSYRWLLWMFLFHFHYWWHMHLCTYTHIPRYFSKVQFVSIFFLDFSVRVCIYADMRIYSCAHHLFTYIEHIKWVFIRLSLIIMNFPFSFSILMKYALHTHITRNFIHFQFFPFFSIFSSILFVVEKKIDIHIYIYICML